MDGKLLELFLWSCGLKRTMGSGAGSIPSGEGIFGQCMRSVATQHDEEFQ